jgi:hypothetical protein
MNVEPTKYYMAKDIISESLIRATCSIDHYQGLAVVV